MTNRARVVNNQSQAVAPANNTMSSGPYRYDRAADAWTGPGGNLCEGGTSDYFIVPRRAESFNLVLHQSPPTSGEFVTIRLSRSTKGKGSQKGRMRYQADNRPKKNFMVQAGLQDLAARAYDQWGSGTNNAWLVVYLTCDFS